MSRMGARQTTDMSAAVTAAGSGVVSAGVGWGKAKGEVSLD